MKKAPIAALVAVLLVLVLAVAVALSPGPLAFDASILHSASELRSDGLTELMLIVTAAGGSTLMMPVGLVLFLVALRKHRRLGVYVGVTLLGSFALNQGLKALVDRPRPVLVDAVYSAMHASFPSGHSQASATFAVSTLVVLTSFKGRLSKTAFGLAAAYVVLVGLSRIYLGVHYPTDILAGWTLGLLVGWVGFVAIKPLGHQPNSRPRFEDIDRRG